MEKKNPEILGPAPIGIRFILENAYKRYQEGNPDIEGKVFRATRGGYSCDIV